MFLQFQCALSSEWSGKSVVESKNEEDFDLNFKSLLPLTNQSSSVELSSLSFIHGLFKRKVNKWQQEQLESLVELFFFSTIRSVLIVIEELGGKIPLENFLFLSVLMCLLKNFFLRYFINSLLHAI